MDPLAIFIQVLAGSAIVITLIATLAVLMRGSKS